MTEDRGLSPTEGRVPQPEVAASLTVLSPHGSVVT